MPWLRAHAPDYDAVVVHGVWQYTSLAVWRALRRGPVPYFVYFHGMLDPWFKRAYPLKHLKKWLYWPWADYRVARDAKAVLFTAREEARLAAQSFWLYRVTPAVVGYGLAQEGPVRRRARWTPSTPRSRRRATATSCCSSRASTRRRAATCWSRRSRSWRASMRARIS